MRTLLDVLDKLDHASMAAQRKLTIPREEFDYLATLFQRGF